MPIRGLRLSLRQPAGSRRIHPRGISTATARASGGSETPWRDHAAHSRLAQAQRVGLCRIHLRVDRGSRRALPRQGRTSSICPAGIAGSARCLVCDPAAKPAVAGKGGIGVVEVQVKGPPSRNLSPRRRTTMKRNETLSLRRLALIATSIGTLTVGVFAIGALAIGRLAIRRVRIESAQLKSLEIGELTVSRLRARQVIVSDSLELR